MLQQTSAAVVGPRWKRFLRRFPTLDRLAAASEEEVLAEWSGLGYYARARNLLVAARVIGSSSRFPGSARELRKLPGVGEYTAAAVASIAFSERVAAVDTNARRVLARLMAHDRALELRRFAELLVPAAASGDHNQAVMDLGATVCLPGAPRCPECPLVDWCAGFRSGRARRFGARPRPPRTRKVALAAGLTRRGGKLLLIPDTEMVRGHLTLPSVAVAEGTDPASALLEAWPRLAGCRPTSIEPCGTVFHSVLGRRYRVALFFVVESKRDPQRPAGTRLVAEGEIPTLSRGSFLDKAVAVSRCDVPGTRVVRSAGPGRGRRAAAPPKRRGG